MRKPKDERLHFRVTSDQKNIIARAAELQGLSMTEFLLRATYKAATELILDQVDRTVSPSSWSVIEEALNEPAKELSSLEAMIDKYDVDIEPSIAIAQPGNLKSDSNSTSREYLLEQKESRSSFTSSANSNFVKVQDEKVA